MSEKLKLKIVEFITNYLREILLIQQEVVRDRRKKGIRTYRIDECNREIELIKDRFCRNDFGMHLYKKIANDLLNNMFLTNEEIDKFLLLVEKGLLKFEIQEYLSQSRSRGSVMNLIWRMLLEEESNKENEDSKFYRMFRFFLELDNIKKFDFLILKSSINDGFYFRNFKLNYICFLDNLENDHSPEFIKEIDTRYIYLSKNLFIVKINDEQNNEVIGMDILYKDNEKWYSTTSDKVYDDSQKLDVEASFNKLIINLGLNEEDVYTAGEIREILCFIDKLDDIEDLKKLVQISADWFEEAIFNSSSDIDYYSEYNKLLPTYSDEQRKNFRDELKKIITKNLLEYRELELNTILEYNNQLIKLMNDLLIIPSPFVIGKVMNIDFCEKEIIVTDKKTGKTELIFKKDTNSKKLNP